MANLEINQFVEKFLGAWNSSEVDKVAACYSEDLIYKDPNTNGAVTDQKSFKRYLTKLLGNWDMTWSSKEAFEFTEGGGWAFLWRAEIKKPGANTGVTIDGMDLVVIKDGLISRNEVYFDRSALLPLM